jgi:hypothetical protein
MKKKYLIISSIFLGAVLLLNGCEQEEFFKLERPTEPAWLDVKSFDYSVMGVYAKVARSYTNNRFYHGSIRYKTILSDEMGLCPYHIGLGIPQRDIYPRPVEESGFLRPDGYIGEEGSFGHVYQSIALANKALEFYYSNDKKPFGTVDVNKQKNIERIVGELHFLRAAFYQELATIFLPWYIPGEANNQGQLPFYTATPATIEESKKSDLITTGELYEFIKRDLKIAISLMPEEFDPTIHPVTAEYGRAYKPAARAVLAQTHFIMHEWDSAVAQIDSIEMTGLFGVDENILGPWTNAGEIYSLYGRKSPEVLWYFVWDEPQSEWFSGWGAFSELSWNNMRGSMGGRLLEAGVYDTHTSGQGKNHWGHAYYVSIDALKEFGWANPDGSYLPYPEIFDIIKDNRFRYLFVFDQGYLSDSVMQALASNPDHKIRTLFRQETLDMLESYNETDTVDFIQTQLLKKELEKYGIWEPRHPEVDTNRYFIPFKWFRVPSVKGQHWQGSANMNLIRWPELLLTRAIIYNMGGNGVSADPAKAAQDVNSLREERIRDFVPKDSYTNEEIHTERKIEMFAEGDRLDYLRALQLPIPAGDRIPTGTSTREQDDFNETPPDRLVIYPPYDGLYWNIPALERDGNKAY